MLILNCPPSTNNFSSLYFSFTLSRSSLCRFALPALGIWEYPRLSWSAHAHPFHPSFLSQGFGMPLADPSGFLQPLLWLSVYRVTVHTGEKQEQSGNSLSPLFSEPPSLPSLPDWRLSQLSSHPRVTLSESSDFPGTSHSVLFVFSHSFLKSKFPSSSYSFSMVDFQEAASGQCSLSFWQGERMVYRMSRCTRKGGELETADVWAVRTEGLPVHTKRCFLMHLILKV